MNRIILMGLPGSGKSFHARDLAQKLGWKALDTDVLIEEKFQQSVARIFDEQGEKFFRLQERAVLEDIIKMENIVVATGGGLPCDQHNIQIIKEGSISVWLNVPQKILAERIWKDGPTRPFFTGKTEAEIVGVLNQLTVYRDLYYAQAQYTITSPEELTELDSIRLLLPHGKTDIDSRIP